ncbi:MAG: isoprenylcysteine carboxyl methyltransferase family protein [Rhizomicrobium sp.]|jgi:methyltransferase
MTAYAILAFVVIQRLAELAYAQHNTRALLARGAVEIGRAQYPLFVALHAAWLISVALALPKAPSIHWAALAGYVVLELLRAWTMWSLGPYWTTRIVTLPDVALVRRGPYRFLRHPNYVIVTGEIALLPLIFGELWVAAIFSLLNAMLLFWRIREEESALAPRRALSAG